MGTWIRGVGEGEGGGNWHRHHFKLLLSKRQSVSMSTRFSMFAGYYGVFRGVPCVLFWAPAGVVNYLSCLSYSRTSLSTLFRSLINFHFVEKQKGKAIVGWWEGGRGRKSGGCEAPFRILITSEAWHHAAVITHSAHFAGWAKSQFHFILMTEGPQKKREWNKVVKKLNNFKYTCIEHLKLGYTK